MGLILKFREKEKIKDSDFELEKSDLMQKCCKQLNEWGVHYLVKSQFHVRIGSVNFYPTKGTIYVDGCVAKYKKKGLDFLKEVLKKEGYLK